MLYQLHWQKYDDIDDTIYVAQFDCEKGDDCSEKIMQTVEARRAECPEDYHAMVCDEEYRHFKRDIEAEETEAYYDDTRGNGSF